MAEALITLKLTPGEFDLVREGITFAMHNAQSVAEDRSNDVKIRHDARQNAVQLNDIIARLK